VAEEAPVTESIEYVHTSEESDEIDHEIEDYFKNLRSSNAIRFDDERLNRFLRESEKSDSSDDDERYTFSNITPAATESDHPGFKTHTVIKGDTIWGISRKYDVKPDIILKHNPELNNRVLYIGEEILIVDPVEDEAKIQEPQLFQHRVRSGESLWTISRRYGIPLNDIYRLNGMGKRSILQPGQIVRLSRVKLHPDFVYQPFFQWPLSGRITSGYGRRYNPFARSTRQFHKGIDIGVPMGTRFQAAREGVVIFSARFKGYGNCIFIRHSNGYVSVYGHNKLNLVKKGDIVARGQVIGEVGRTGMATGPHLHFEIRRRTQPINPRVALNLKEAVFRKKVALAK
jgi:murein DD-endopeptidase MepM/ murein hydrolase activator NlpD